jgi:hypothetical protein
MRISGLICAILIVTAIALFLDNEPSPGPASLVSVSSPSLGPYGITMPERSIVVHNSSALLSALFARNCDLSVGITSELQTRTDSYELLHLCYPMNQRHD